MLARAGLYKHYHLSYFESVKILSERQTLLQFRFWEAISTDVSVLWCGESRVGQTSRASVGNLRHPLTKEIQCSSTPLASRAFLDLSGKPLHAQQRFLIAASVVRRKCNWPGCIAGKRCKTKFKRHMADLWPIYLAASGRFGSKAQPSRMSVRTLTLALIAGMCLAACQANRAVKISEVFAVGNSTPSGLCVKPALS